MPRNNNNPAGNFLTDLQHERKVLNYLFVNNPTTTEHLPLVKDVFFIEGMFSYYDLLFAMVDGTVERVECKIDKLAQETGNVCVEIECRGKPSSLSITTSDSYCFILPNHGTDETEIIFIKTSNLKSITNDTPTVNIGEGNVSKCHLVKRETITNGAYLNWTIRRNQNAK